MKVDVFYRNYIPLYSGYSSFWLEPPEGVEFYIPPVRDHRNLYRIYSHLKILPFSNYFGALGNAIFFKKQDTSSNADLCYYAGMLPSKVGNIPFVVDFEHVFSLFNYSQVNQAKMKYVWEVLSHKKCIGILPWSKAALRTLKKLYEKEYAQIQNKVEVLYPALPIYKKLYSRTIDWKFVTKNNQLKLLFVGKDYKRKGLIEILEALKIINGTSYSLYVVSNVDDSVKRKYKDLNVHYFKANFSLEELVTNFFLTCDVFLLPTHADTFGMVLLEALACGMPVITTDQFAANEIVINGWNGFLVQSDYLFLNKTLIPDKRHTGLNYGIIDPKLVGALSNKLKYLINNPNKIVEMKGHATTYFRPGERYSISSRNEKLNKIFKHALK